MFANTTAIAFALAAAASGVMAQDASEPLQLSVRPTVTPAPGAVRVVVTVERHRDNRALVIEADSPAFFRSSLLQLEGEADARTHTLLLTSLPAGVYTITAKLRGTNGARGVDKCIVEVVGALHR
jgi:hypothetical protein